MMRRLSRNAAGLKGGVVAASVERLRRTNGRGELFGQVVDALFRKADSGLLQVLDQAALEGLSTLAFDFFELAGDDINLRALNPSAEAHGFDLPYSLLLVSLKDRPFIVDSLTRASFVHAHHRGGGCHQPTAWDVRLLLSGPDG